MKHLDLSNERLAKTVTFSNVITEHLITFNQILKETIQETLKRGTVGGANMISFHKRGQHHRKISENSYAQAFNLNLNLISKPEKHTQNVEILSIETQSTESHQPNDLQITKKEDNKVFHSAGLQKSSQLQNRSSSQKEDTIKFDEKKQVQSSQHFRQISNGSQAVKRKLQGWGSMQRLSLFESVREQQNKIVTKDQSKLQRIKKERSPQSKSFVSTPLGQNKDSKAPQSRLRINNSSSRQSLSLNGRLSSQLLSPTVAAMNKMKILPSFEPIKKQRSQLGSNCSSIKSITTPKSSKKPVLNKDYGIILNKKAKTQQIPNISRNSVEIKKSQQPQQVTNSRNQCIDKFSKTSYQNIKSVKDSNSHVYRNSLIEQTTSLLLKKYSKRQKTSLNNSIFNSFAGSSMLNKGDILSPKYQNKTLKVASCNQDKKKIKNLKQQVTIDTSLNMFDYGL
ncbi:UNKNOWN [Stylonychia lemnae]|uniref:Uncharacterized protein n=1 Tax=Stylonychia lemnae TaxID=5949 RepID=A0A078A115_STYLE|nr:UNKNOWN [Stylonychia lemnae]|eukprot:CDW75805.1 UNKNOWN [Stylonychia lemnae]